MTIRPALRLAERRHWVFDMDGTLTQAVHDFPAIKRALGIAEQEDILQHLAALPAAEAAAKARAKTPRTRKEMAAANRAAPPACVPPRR